MHVIIFTLLLGALLALWVLWTTKEPYVGKRSYAVHDMANYPGGDIDSNGQWVKNIAACRTLCDANADKCFGFAINRKRDTSQPKNAQLKCYLKTKEQNGRARMAIADRKNILRLLERCLERSRRVGMGQRRLRQQLQSQSESDAVSRQGHETEPQDVRLRRSRGRPRFYQHHDGIYGGRDY